MALTRPKIWDIDTGIEYFMDPITTLHQGSTQANVDVGFIFNRANGLVSNVALYWNETKQSFTTAYTTSTGVTDSNIAVTSYANITVGNVFATGLFWAGNGAVIQTGGGGGGGSGSITVSQITNGTKSNTVSNVTSINFDTITGFFVQDLGGGEVEVHLGSGFKYISVSGQSNIVAVGEDTLTFVAGNNVSLSTDPISKALTINANIPGVTGFSSNSAVVVSYNTDASTTTSGALQVDGGLGVQGNIVTGNLITAGASGTGNIDGVNTITATNGVFGNVYTSGLFWAGNGQVIQTGGGGGGGNTYNITYSTLSNTTPNPVNYTGKYTVGTSAVLIDTLPVFGNTYSSWKIVAVDNANNNFLSETFDTVNDGTNIYYSQSAIIRSNLNATVVVLSSTISGGNINLYATGDSGNVSISFERTLLGSSTYVGYVGGQGPTGAQGPIGPGGTINNTGGNIVTTSANIANNFTSGALQVPNGGASIGGNLWAGNIYSNGLFWAGNGQVIQTGGGGSITFNANAAPPTSGNTIGSQWYSTTTDTLYEYTFDGSNYYWIDITSPTIAAPGSNIGNIYPVSGGATFLFSNLLTASATFTIGSSTQAINKVYAGNVYASALLYPNGAPFTSNSINYTTSTTPPTTGNKLGDIWYNSAADITYEYTNDGLGTYWVDISSPPIYAVGGSTVGNIASATAGNTFVSANLIPISNGTFSIGALGQAFQNLYLTGTATIGGAKYIVDPVTGAIAIVPLPTSITPSPTATVITPTGQVTTVSTTAGAVTTAAIGNAANTVATSTTFSNVTVTSSTPSTSSTTGALIVTGGTGIGGNLYVTGNIFSANGIQNTAIGNTTPNTGNFTSLNATSLTVSGAFSAGTINGATIIGPAVSGGSINNTTIGASVPTTAVFTTATATNVVASTFTVSNGIFWAANGQPYNPAAVFNASRTYAYGLIFGG